MEFAIFATRVRADETCSEYAFRFIASAFSRVFSAKRRDVILALGHRPREFNRLDPSAESALHLSLAFGRS